MRPGWRFSNNIFVTLLKVNVMKLLEKKGRQKTSFKSKNTEVKINNVNREMFCGAINLKIDPVTYQRKSRNEWK
jgi:hypothetical protein